MFGERLRAALVAQLWQFVHRKNTPWLTSTVEVLASVLFLCFVEYFWKRPQLVVYPNKCMFHWEVSFCSDGMQMFTLVWFSGSENEYVVTWNINDSLMECYGSSEVLYGLEKGFPIWSVAGDCTMFECRQFFNRTFYIHRATLTGLSPFTRYCRNKPFRSCQMSENDFFSRLSVYYQWQCQWHLVLHNDR